MIDLLQGSGLSFVSPQFASSLCPRLEVAICASGVLLLTKSHMSLMLGQGTSLIATVIKATASHISDSVLQVLVFSQELEAMRLTSCFRLPLPNLLCQVSHVWSSMAIPMLCSKLRTRRVHPQTTILSNVQNK